MFIKYFIKLQNEKQNNFLFDKFMNTNWIKNVFKKTIVNPAML
jgi:hypothetical protein